MSKKVIHKITLEDLIDAYDCCIKNKRGSNNAMNYVINWEENTYNLWNDIRFGNYTIGSSIAFICTRPKYREIFAADFRDRVVHHYMINKIMPLLDNYFIKDTYSCQLNKGTLFGTYRTYEKLMKAGPCWIGKFDIKNFFMSIYKPILWNMVNDFITERYNGYDKETLLYLFKLIIFHRPQDNCIKKTPHGNLWNYLESSKSLFKCSPDRGMAIGNLTSQILANLYLSQFDLWMSELFPLGYGRYVDDFYIMDYNKERIKNTIPEIEHYLQENLKLKLHPVKRSIQHSSKGISFIGSFIKPNKIFLGNRSKTNIYNKINYFNNIKEYTPENLHNIVGTLNSYFGLFVHTYSFNTFKDIVQKRLSKKLIDKLTFTYRIKHTRNSRGKLVKRKIYIVKEKLYCKYLDTYI